MLDDQSVKQLELALKATPDNMALVQVLLRAYQQRRQWDSAVALARSYGPAQLHDPALACLAAEVCLDAAEPELALRFLADSTPACLLLKAKCLLALDRLDEGLSAYRQAVDENAALEDKSLEMRLQAKVTELHGKQGPVKLRVIANDDTDQSEGMRLLRPEAEKVTFADVGGLEHVKKAVRKKIITPFQKPSLYQRFRKRVGGGILLYGPPGCGKTLLARATAGECNAAFFSVAISDILDMYIGESERKLHAIFETARQAAPSVVFFDEVEAIGGKRQYTREGTSSKLVSQFLSEMDGFAQNNHGVLILAASNVPWALDSAFRRPGRFDRVLFVPPPDREARLSILKLLLDGRPMEEAIDYALLAKNTSGFSGADLRELVETAVDEAIEESIDTGVESSLRNAHFLKALKEVKPTTMEWLTTARNYAKYSNESGQYNDVLDFLKQHGKA